MYRCSLGSCVRNPVVRFNELDKSELLELFSWVGMLSPYSFRLNKALRLPRDHGFTALMKNLAKEDRFTLVCLEPWRWKGWIGKRKYWFSVLRHLSSECSDKLNALCPCRDSNRNQQIMSRFEGASTRRDETETTQLFIESAGVKVS